MLVFFRQCLVLLLVILQYAAPLVHAHTGGDDFQRGLHLYEFEKLHLIADSLTITSADHVLVAESAIVNIGSAIKPQQTLDKALEFFCLLVCSSLLLSTDEQRHKAFTSAFGPILISQPYLWHNSSRAPPVSFES